MNALCFNLGGVGFELRAKKGIHPPALPPAYAPFIVDAVPSTAGFFSIHPPGAKTLEAISQPFWTCPTWRMGTTSDRRTGIEIHSVTTDSWLPVANLENDFSSGTIVPLAGRRGEGSPFALNYPYDQAILINRLGHFNAGVVHSSGIAFEGAGLLFGGRSDIGKTTIARLWRARGATLLNDDRQIIRMVDGQAFLSPTPWHGEDPEINAKTVPLKAIFHLSQSVENRLQPLDETQALAALLATTVAPFYSPGGMQRLLETWSEVVHRVPSYALAFAPDERVVDFCRTQALA